MNLRKLVQKASSVTDVARRLGISRAQFNRFLSGEAHPKPGVLKRICDHFGVDARILTEELPSQYLDTLPEPGTARAPGLLNYGLENAVNALPVSDSHFVSPEVLPDGLYLFWRPSMARLDLYVCTAMRLSTLPGARVFRTYLMRDAGLVTHGLSPAERELCGILLGVQDGYAWLFLHSPAWNNISMVFSGHPAHRFSPYLNGFYALARGEAPVMRRLARCVVEALPPQRASVVRAAHATGRYTRDTLPAAVRIELDRELA